LARRKLPVAVFAEENPYYVWVDQHNILGLGANVSFETGNQSDSLHALVDGHFVELRVPYPMGFFTKGLEGRIDDPNAGWKGRALWASSGNRTAQHIEGIDAPAPGASGKTPRHCPAPSSSSSRSARMRWRISAVFDQLTSV
jgi:hypothetical protein